VTEKNIDGGIDHGPMRCGGLERVTGEIMNVTETAFAQVVTLTEIVEIGVAIEIAVTSGVSVMIDITLRGYCRLLFYLPQNVVR